MRVDVHRFLIGDPGDVAGFEQAIGSGRIDPAQVVAVIGKTHGNGLVNDYTRGYLALALSSVLAETTGTNRDDIKRRIPIILSGGVEGVLTPHFTVITASRSEAGSNDQRPALAVGVAFSRRMSPGEIGREAQIAATEDAVVRAMSQAQIEDPHEVHFVQVKCPAFPLAALDLGADQPKPVSQAPGKLMAFGRAASALGAARALQEVPRERLTEASVLTDFETFSSVASVSAGIEVDSIEVVVLGMSPNWSGPLVIDHEPLRDALDLHGFHALADRLGLHPSPQVEDKDAARIRAAFIKCEADRHGTIRGRPHTMLNDGDLDPQRHIRSAVGAIAAAVLNDTALFVSGGAEQQGPDGGGLVAIVVERG